MALSRLFRTNSHLRSQRIIGASLTLVMLILFHYDLFNELHCKSFDLLIRNMPAPRAKTPVVIVDIDSESLAVHGQWPWPRNTIAELLKVIANAKPAAIGLDMVFAEPDRSSPSRLAAAISASASPVLRNCAVGKDDFFVKEYLKALPDYDQLLAEMLKSSSVPIVLGYAFSTMKQPGRNALPRSSRVVLKERDRSGEPKDPASFFAQKGFHSVDANLELLEHAAQGSGFFTIIRTHDETLRKTPLLVSFGGRLYPNFALAMVQAASGAETLLAEAEGSDVQAVTVGPHRIPTTEKGEMIVWFSGPAHALPYVSAADVLARKVKPAVFKNAYVLVGTSAPGLFDVTATPTDPAFPGVEFHGHVLNAILGGSFLERQGWVRIAECIHLLGICLLLLVLLPKMKAAAGAVLAFAVAAGMIVFWWLNFHLLHIMVDMVYPVIAIALLFTVLTFLNYAAEERKLRHLRSSFSQYLAPAVVEELVERHESLVLNGEERELPIMFSDIRGFTSIAEKMPPKDLCIFLNQYLTPMTAAVMDRRGTVDKFIGDAVMAFWNAPLPTPNHVGLACSCALAMLRELEALNQIWRQQNRPNIRIGIGIHCGIARVGNMGSKQRFEYTVIGDAVNLASRLEGLTKLYGADILVSGAVHAALRQSGFIFRQVDTVRVAGKMEPVAVYQLLGEHQPKKDSGWTRENVQKARQNRLCRRGLALYRNGDFQAAECVFRNLLQECPEDKLYTLYVSRCRELAAQPPLDWDGVTNLRFK